MAKIILNVELKSKEAATGLDKLVGKIRQISELLEDVKPNKDLTAQLNALVKAYKTLEEQARKTAEQEKKKATEDANAAIQAAKKKKAEEEAAAATKKRETAETNHAAALKKKEAAEINAAEAADKHRAAQEKRAAAAEKARKADEEEEKPLWNLEKAYAALVEYNRGRSEEIEDTDTLKERYDRLSASLASVVADTKEQSEVIRSNQEQMEKWDKALRKADEDAQSLDTRLYALLKRISNEENRYETGVFDDVKTKIGGIIKETEQLDRTDVNFIDRERELSNQTANVVNELTKIEATASHAAPAVDTLGAKFGDLIAKYAKFYASSLLVRKPLEAIKNALGEVTETLVKTENAVIEINRVLDDEDQQPTAEISNRLYDLAYQYGSTFDAAATIASNFARAGRSWADSLKATEAALLAMNVAELNATEASDGLLSIIAQFDMEASDLIDVVDKLNKTADKNPVSTQKLLQAIQRAGSAAKNANVSFDQTLGLITAISEATNRSGQNIGTAINSLIQYSTKNVDVFASLSAESEAVVDKFKTGLASIVDVWNQVSIDIKNNKEARDNIISALGTDGLEELSSTLHDELGDLVSEIDGVYNVANTYRKNYFIALLDNMDRFMKVQEQLTDYQGYSQKENKKYMETYTAKVNQLNDAWQKLANDEQGILGFKKDLVDAGISLVNLAEKMGGIKTAAIEMSSILLNIMVFFKAKDIAKWIVDFNESLAQTGQYIKEFPQLIEKARIAQEAYAAAVMKTAAGEEVADLAQKKAAASAAAWQAALGWIAIIATVITVVATGINAVIKAQEEARDKAIEHGKETANTAKEIAALRAEMLKLNPESEEYRKIEEQIVELLGDKKVLLEDLIPGTEEYTEKIKELTQAEITEAKYRSIKAKEAAIKNANKDFDWSANMQGLTYEDKDLTILATSAKTIEEKYQVYLKISGRLKELEKEYVIAVANGDKTQQNSLDNRIKALEKFVDNTAESMEEYRIAVENETALARIALTNVTASMQKIPAAARMSQEELQAIADENGMTLEEIQEAYERLGTGAAESLEQVGEETKQAFDKAKGSLEEFTEYVSGTVGGYLAAANAVKTVTAAQKEYAENGKLTLETVDKLAKLGAEWVDVLFDETGAVDVNTTAVREQVAAARLALAERGYAIEEAKLEADAVETVTEKLKDYGAEIDETQASLNTLNAIQQEYDETGSLSIDTLQKLLELGGEYVDLIIDEQGQLSLDAEKVENLKKKKLNLIEQLIRENTAQYALSLIQEKAAEKEAEVGKQAENAALKIGEFVAQLYTLKGQSTEAVIYLDALKQSLASIGSEMGIALTEEELNEITEKSSAYYEKLERAFALTDTSGGWQSSSGSSSSSGSKKDEYLETLKSAVSLRESELTLMEHQGASEDAQIAKIREIQAALSEEADYLRSIGASQEDINKLSSEWWKWQEKINKFGEDAAKEAEKAREEAEKAAKKAQEEAEKAAEEARKAQIAALNEETNRHKQVISDLKAELNLWQKQGKSVSDQVDEMKKIQSALHDEAEWLRYLKATQTDIIVNQADIDALSAEWWDWQEKILKLYQETLEAQKELELDAIQKTIDAIIKEIDLEEEALDLEEKRLAVDEQRQKLEEAIAQAKIDYVQSVLSDYISALSDAETLEEKQRAVAEAREKLVQAQREAQAKSIIDAFKAEKDVKSDTLTLEEKRLAVEKARQALADAENNRTTRVYNEASGQWEYQANARDVQSAKDNLAKAVEALNSYVEEQAWNEVAEAVENGSVSEAEVLEILSKWAKEAYGNDSPEFIAKIQAAFKKAMGTAASPDSVSGQISAVDNAIKNLNEYLKSEAVKELKAYIAAGNTDFAGMRSILDKWLAMGEGSELYEWRDGLLATVTDAIRSGAYDDTKVTSQVQAVENAVNSLHDYLRNRFIREIEDLVKNGSAEDIRNAIDAWNGQFDMSESDRDWANRLADAREDYDRTESMWNGITDGRASDAEKAWVIEQMKKNSAEWWTADEARRKELANLNYALGTSMGWHRNEESGIWYDDNGNRVYDKGGVLRGRGGIKGTSRPEIVLDPELTSQILRPGSEAQFRAFADAMHLMFERGGRIADERPVIRNPAVTDSHNTSYTVNGIPIAQNMAERYTIVELFRVMPTARA